MLYIYIYIYIYNITHAKQSPIKKGTEDYDLVVCDVV